MSEVRSTSSSPAARVAPREGVRSPLVEALSQSAEVKEKIEGIADELLIVNTVLKHEIPAKLQTGDVAQALDKHDELEDIVQECVVELVEVNEALEEEVARREGLERELAQSQAELARSQAEQSSQASKNGPP
ncbi:MAG: hypothetical protein JWQ88_1300 [Rhodoferax sp.]|nr:hypothetical protein [Rhodoferax sp.]